MEKETLVTLGYTEPEAAQRVKDFLAQPRARLVDIRYSPWCRWNPRWSKNALQAVHGKLYIHLRGFGNVNYNQPGKPIQLFNPERHLPAVVNALRHGYALMFLCACKDYERCHRKTVYDLVIAALAETERNEQEELAVAIARRMNYVEARGIMMGPLPDGRLICTTVGNFVDGLSFMPMAYLDDPANWLGCVDGKEVWIEGREVQ